jgi:hypothetical protein
MVGWMRMTVACMMGCKGMRVPGVIMGRALALAALQLTVRDLGRVMM